MAMILDTFQLAYYPSPKVACTSLKTALYRLENSQDWQDFRIDGKTIYIHDHIPSDAFEPLEVQKSHYFKFAILRDPIDRFLSAYQNRVVDFGELSAEHIASHPELEGLPLSPTISEFVENLERYRSISPSIRHHTEPQHVFIGSDLSYYDRVFRFEEVQEIPEILYRITGIKFELPHQQKSLAKIKLSDLSKRDIRGIEWFYREDYALVSKITPISMAARTSHRAG
jgi:hypothetical protein